MTVPRFSEKHGYNKPDAEITIRKDAPREFRRILTDIAYESGLTPETLRTVVCRVLREREKNNWSDPYITEEVQGLLDGCPWWEVYNIAEEVRAELRHRSVRPRVETEQLPEDYFQSELNRYFHKLGIGWQLTEQGLVTRGPKDFEEAVGAAVHELAAAKRVTAAGEIREALADLSRRPNPELTGAVQHAMAALECVCRDIAGEKGTLGEVLKKAPSLFPKPLDDALQKLWGFASERGRHLIEGREPRYAEAQLVVHVAASCVSYLQQASKSV